MTGGDGFVLGVDFGTSNTVAMLRRPDGRVTPLLFDGTPVLPSAVFAAPDRSLFVGRDALHHGRHRPAGLEPNPKRHIDEGTVLLSGTERTVPDLVGAVLGRVADEARRVAGDRPGTLVLSHPAGWGPVRRLTLCDAAVDAGLPTPVFVPEPVAAAMYFTSVLRSSVPSGAALLVYDLGAGTFDVTVLRAGASFEVLGSDGLDDVGGLDVDAAVVTWLRTHYDDDAWDRLSRPTSAEDRRLRLDLWAEARVAKEMLSRTAAVVMRPPLLEQEIPLTLAEFESITQPLIDRTVRTAQGLARYCEVTAAQVLLVGGSSRIPLVATALHRAFGVPPTVTEQPETVVAEGCVFAPGVRPPDRDPVALSTVLPIGAGLTTEPFTADVGPGALPAAPLGRSVLPAMPGSAVGVPWVGAGTAGSQPLGVGTLLTGAGSTGAGQAGTGPTATGLADAGLADAELTGAGPTGAGPVSPAPAPASPAPASPAPASPAPASPASVSPASVSPAPASPAPAGPASASPAPASPAPAGPASASPASASTGPASPLPSNALPASALPAGAIPGARAGGSTGDTGLLWPPLPPSIAVHPLAGNLESTADTARLRPVSHGTPRNAGPGRQLQRSPAQLAANAHSAGALAPHTPATGTAPITAVATVPTATALTATGPTGTATATTFPATAPATGATPTTNVAPTTSAALTTNAIPTTSATPTTNVAPTTSAALTTNAIPTTSAAPTTSATPITTTTAPTRSASPIGPAPVPGSWPPGADPGFWPGPPASAGWPSAPPDDEVVTEEVPSPHRAAPPPRAPEPPPTAPKPPPTRVLRVPVQPRSQPQPAAAEPVLPGARPGRARAGLALLAVVLLLAAAAVTLIVTMPHPRDRTGARPSASPPFPTWSVRYADSLGTQRGWSAAANPVEKVECAFRNGRLEIDMRKGGIFRCPGQRDELTDFALQLDVYLLDGQACAGIWFRRGTHEGGRDSSYVLKVCRNQLVLGHHHADGDIAEFAKFPVAELGAGVRTVVGLVVRGSDISLYLHGGFVGTRSDTVFPGGRVALGIAVSRDLGAGRVGFSNVELRTP